MSFIYKSIVSTVSGAVAAQLNPALTATKPPEEIRTELFKRENHTRLTIPTTDGFSLDGIKIGAPDSEKAIILCLGAGGCYEELQSQPDGVLANMVASLRNKYSDRSILIVNSRGVGASTGYPYFDECHKIDIDSIVANTKQSHKDIVVWGHSMGGLMAVKSDEKMVLDRTFTSVSEIIVNKLGLVGFGATAVASLVWALGWEYNLHDRLGQLDPDRVKVLYSKDDATIPTSVSLGAKNQAKPFVVEMSEREAANAHTAPLDDIEFKKLDILIV